METVGCRLASHSDGSRSFCVSVLSRGHPFVTRLISTPGVSLREESRRNDDIGLTHVHHFYTKRNLVVASALFDKSKSAQEKGALLGGYTVGLKTARFLPLRWINKDTGEVVSSHAIITTVSNALTQKIGHHRSPVILSEEDEKDWLDPTMPLQEVVDMLRPYPAHLMNAYPIDKDIKSPKANGVELLKPIGERIYKEYDYVIYEDIELEGMGSTTARKRKEFEDSPETPTLFDDM